MVDGKPASGKLSLDGRLGNMRLALSGDANGVIAEPEKANLRLDARIASDDGALISVLGLDRFAPAERRPTNLTFTANGPLSGDMRVDAKVAGEGFELAGAGSLKVSDWDAAGTLNVSFNSTDLAALRRAGAPAFPVTIKSSLKVAGGALNFSTLDGKAGGSAVKGQLALAVAQKQPWNVDGKSLRKHLMCRHCSLLCSACPHPWRLPHRPRRLRRFPGHPSLSHRLSIRTYAAASNLKPHARQSCRR